MATSTKKPRKMRVSHQLRTRCPLVTMGPPMLGDDGWIIVNADTPLYISIKPEMAKYSVVRSGRYCIVARAMDAALGDRYDYIVGAGVIKIIDKENKVVVRLCPTDLLRKAIRKFDKSKDTANPTWDLPPNLYRLAPLPKSWRYMYENPKEYAAEVAARRKAKERAAKKRAGHSGATVVVGGTRKKPSRRRMRASVTRVIMRHAGTGKKLVRR